MKREFLEGFGLDKETVDKIMQENGTDIQNARNSEKAKFDTERTGFQTQISNLQGQVTQRDTDLETLKGQLTAAQTDAGQLTAAQEALTALQGKYEGERQAWEQQRQAQRYEFAVKTAARDLRFTSAAAERDFVNQAIGKNLQMDGDKILGLTDFVDQYKAADPGAFVVESTGAQATQADAVQITLPANTPAPGKTMSLSEAMAAKNANPAMEIKFADSK